MEYYRTIHEIIKTGHWITDQVSIVLKPFDITEPQYNVLRVLETQKPKPLTVASIQEEMVQRSSNVTRIIDKLLLKELVERKECVSNRRKMDITITEEGSKLLGLLDKAVYEFNAPMMSNLSDKELKTLRQLIKKLKATT